MASLPLSGTTNSLCLSRPRRLFYQESIFGGPTPNNISAPALALLPNLAYDSWVTIGLDGPASAADGEVNPSLLAGSWDDTFENGNSFVVDDNQGSDGTSSPYGFQLLGRRRPPRPRGATHHRW